MMPIQEFASLVLPCAIAMIAVKVLGWVVRKTGNLILQQKPENREPPPAIQRRPGRNSEKRNGDGMNNRKQAIQHDERLP